MNSFFGFPFSKKILLNSISLKFGYWVDDYLIYFMATLFFEILCSPNQTKENPPFPNNFILLYYYGKLLHSSSIVYLLLLLVILPNLRSTENALLNDLAFVDY